MKIEENNNLIENIVLNLGNTKVKLNVNKSDTDIPILKLKLLGSGNVQDIDGMQIDKINYNAIKKLKQIRAEQSNNKTIKYKSDINVNFNALFDNCADNTVSLAQIYRWDFSTYLLNKIVGISFEIYNGKHDDSVHWCTLVLPTNKYSDYNGIVSIQLIGSDDLISLADFTSLLKLTYEGVKCIDEEDYPNIEYYINNSVVKSKYSSDEITPKVVITEYDEYITIQLLLNNN